MFFVQKRGIDNDFVDHDADHVHRDVYPVEVRSQQVDGL